MTNGTRPSGTRPSADGVVRAAARTLMRGRRLDTSALAAELGMSRPTLFRRVGNREELMGEALWHLAERTLAAVEARWDRAHRDSPGLRCTGVIREYGAVTGASPGFRRLLDEEPAVAVRVLTDPFGRVQPRVIKAFVGLLRTDVAALGLTPQVDLETLGYAITRLGESIVYADVIAGRPADLDAAATMVDRLVEGVLQVHPHSLPHRAL